MAKSKKIILNRVVSLVLFLAATIVFGLDIYLGNKISILPLVLVCGGIVIRLWVYERKENKQ